MFRQTFKMFFVGLAAIDISRERLEQCFSSMVAKAIGVGHDDAERLEILRERIKAAVVETSQRVVQRSEVLESQFHDKLRRQVADLSLDALGDSSEINELRAEIASLRAELVQLRSNSAA